MNTRTKAILDAQLLLAVVLYVILLFVVLKKPAEWVRMATFVAVVGNLAWCWACRRIE